MIFPLLVAPWQHAFMVVRGLKVREEDVQNWHQKIGTKFKIPGFSSTSSNPAEAMNYCVLTTEDQKKGLKPFLFVFLIAARQLLFHLDSEEYTAFPQEREVLLMEGTVVDVLGREELFSSRYQQDYTIFYSLLI